MKKTIPISMFTFLILAFFKAYAGGFPSKLSGFSEDLDWETPHSFAAGGRGALSGNPTPENPTSGASKIQEIDLFDNNISNKGAVALRMRFHDIKTMTGLTLLGNNVADVHALVIRK